MTLTNPFEQPVLNSSIQVLGQALGLDYQE